MSKLTKEIELFNSNSSKYDIPMEIVKIKFSHKTDWVIFNIKELLEILRLWNKGEEKRYPLDEGYKGRWLLFDEILKVFNEGLPKEQQRRVISGSKKNTNQL
jgi:hypothetical protein